MRRLEAKMDTKGRNGKMGKATDRKLRVELRRLKEVLEDKTASLSKRQAAKEKLSRINGETDQAIQCYW